MNTVLKDPNGHSDKDFAAEHHASAKLTDVEFIKSVLRVVLDDDKYLIVHGNNIVSKNKFTYEFAAWDYVMSKPYEIILYFCSIMQQYAIDKCMETLKNNNNEKTS